MQEGRFKARACSWGLGYTSTGKEQVAVELKLTEEVFTGERITWYGYFTEGTQERTFESLRALGWEGDDLSNLTGLDKNEVSIVVQGEEYQGRTSLKVKFINPLGGLALKETMTPDQAKAFARRMKGWAVASRQAKPANAESKAKTQRDVEEPPF